MHTSEIITQPTSEALATCRSDLLPPILKPGLILMMVWKTTTTTTTTTTTKLLSVLQFLQSHSVSDRNGFLLNRFCL